MNDSMPAGESGAWQTPLAPGEPRSFGGGRYVVHRRLGAGNFATVYLAHDDRLAVAVAVKLLSDRWSWEPEVRGRFVQEARLLRSLNDPHVVQIRDIAETEDGRPYLVMDFATEGTLEQRSLEMTQRGARPGVEDLRVAARALAAALGVLHERRIAHRDIKPSNLLLTRNTAASKRGTSIAGPADTAVVRPGERLMLGDLGLAKDLSFDSGITVGVGTAGYMAPEQTLPGAKIDTRTDIYAASALLAQLASGESPDPVRRVSNGVIDAGRPLSVNISGPLTAVVLRGLDTDPDGRQQTIEQWLEEVERGLDASDAAPPSTPPANPPANPPAGFARSRRRRRVLVAAVAVVTLAGAAAVIAARSIGGDRGGSGTALPAETGALTVTLSGPTAVKLGAQAAWFVDSPNAIDGTWSLTGEVQPDPPDWNPGNYFQGTWNVEGTFTLTLTVSDAEGNEAADSHDFTVEP